MPNHSRLTAASEAALQRSSFGIDEEIDFSSRPLLHLTQPEVEDLDLLCYSIGSGRNACINFATKYLCSLWLNSTVPVKVPRAQKPSKVAPPLTVEYRLNPEVSASVKSVRSKKKNLQDVSEEEIVKPAILFLCKKLLPAKNRRIALRFPKGGVS